MKKLTFVLFALMLCSASAISPASITITGLVTDASTGDAIPGATVLVKGEASGTTTDHKGYYQIRVPSAENVLVFSFIGYVTIEKKVGSSMVIDIQLEPDIQALSEVVVSGRAAGVAVRRKTSVKMAAPSYEREEASRPQYNTEEYDGIQENIFHDPRRTPLSTFSIDVDAASYSNVRRFINQGQRPPKDAVRIEEMINYFDYQYSEPEGGDPFRVIAEMAPAPWNPRHKLVHIGLQAKNIPTDDLPPSNLVFLIDVSGSMNEANKLPLLKSSFMMLVEELRPQDHVSIVVYAGAAGRVLEPTPGSEKRKIKDALNRLEAGGSTAGGAGIRLAYETALENFREGGNNRVILATDGDFNIGESSNAAMERLIGEKKKEGVFLTVLGFGMGNYKDSKMETLADKGNGNYAYIDNISEARKVLVNEFGGTLFTVAKDVKLQIEFNPARVKSYRLIGYENRLLRDEDFNDDRKDAGDMGAGHTVTALYEIVPQGVDTEMGNIDDLKYQRNSIASHAQKSSEWMNIKVRYKSPDQEVSKLLEQSVAVGVKSLDASSANFRWSASVAAFGMILRESEYVNDFTFDQVVALAEKARGSDVQGYRIEFINMVKSMGLIARQ